MCVLRFVVATLVAVTPGLVAQNAQFETTKIADGVYQFRWESHNSLFVVTSDGVVVIDPISTDAARQLASEIRSAAPGATLRAIVYSHDHDDHATGARVLREEFGGSIPVFAHENACPKIAAAASAELPPPDVTFSQQLTLHFGGWRLELHYLGKSHSDNMVVALLPDARVALDIAPFRTTISPSSSKR